MILAAGSPFDPIYNFFGTILAFFYGIIPNLGVSIILLTILVMLVMFPLTAKQAKSMLAMQRAQPEIKKLQAKYKQDRAKLNEEMMKFYQENKINPLAGCLPLLVQMPVFLALYRVMRDPYKHVPKSSDLYAAFCTGPKGHLYTNQCNLPKLGLPEPAVVPRDGPVAARDGGHRRLPRRTPLLHPRGPRRRDRVPAGPPEPAQRAEHELADGDHHLGAAGRLRPLLTAVPRRPGALLPGEQHLAARSARAHHAQDHPARPGRHRVVDQGRRDRRRGWRDVRVPARRRRTAEAVPDPGGER